jgi:hypothetical protein
MHFNTKRISRPIPTKRDRSSMGFFCWLTASSSTLTLSLVVLADCFFYWFTASSSTPALSSAALAAGGYQEMTKEGPHIRFI